MAGVTGPCPTCGQTVTSPQATPAPFGGFPAAATPTATLPPQQQAPAPGILGGRAPSPNLSGTGFPQNPVMPQGPVKPHVNVAQHLSPPPAAQPAGFPPARPLGAPPETAPPWHQPGLGQTLLGSAPLPTPQPSPAPTPAAAPPAGAGGGFLPPRRPEGQPPSTGNAAPAPTNGWGAGTPMAGAQPGPVKPLGDPAPLSPLMSAPPAAADPRGLWGNRDAPVAAPPGVGPGIPNVQLPPAQQAQAQVQQPQREQQPQSAKPRNRMPKSSGQGGRKPSRSLVMLLVATVAGAGLWLYREPLRQAMGKSRPQAVSVNIPDGANLSSAKPSDGKSSNADAPPPSKDTSAASSGKFDPTEPAAPGLISDDPSAPLAGAAASPDSTSPSLSGLMEVPSRPVEAGIQSRSGAGNDPEDTLASGATPPRLDGVPPQAMPAAEALQKFLMAKDLEERLRYTLAPDSMRDYMERYYAVNASGPVHVETIGFVRLDPKPQVGRGAHAVFGLESRGWQFPVPVMLEETEGGFRVDWLSFVEFKDRLLERFFKEYSEGPARFHVGITRTHYFEDKVPNAAKKDAFNVTTAPPNPFQATVFVDKESALGKELKERISWGAQVWAIAELEWMKLGSHQWVELSAVPQLNWYSVPASPKTSQASHKPETPTEIQRAVPIGR